MRDEIIHSGPGYAVFHGRDAGCFEIDGGIEDHKNHFMTEKTPNNDHLYERKFKLSRKISTKEVHYQDGVIFFCCKGTPIGFHQLTKGTVTLEPDRLKTRQMVLDNLQQLGII